MIFLTRTIINLIATLRVIQLMLCLLFLSNQAISQSSQIRAQARYYSAKTQYQKGDYLGAIIAVKESKGMLNGTNFLLQYLHIMAAYNNGNYKEAQAEMKRYFNLTDKKEAVISFSRDVEDLSSDETTDLVKILDKIDENVTNNTEEKVAQAKKDEEERKAKENEERELMRKKRDCIDTCLSQLN